MSTYEERTLRFGMDRTRRDLLARHDDTLPRGEVERHLELEARRRASREPRAGGVLLLSVEEAARALGVGRTKTYELISAGEIEVVHIGRCARVPVDAVEAYVDRLRGRVPGPSLDGECPSCAGEPVMESWAVARREHRSALPATGATSPRARPREPDGQHRKNLDDGRDDPVPGSVVG